MSLGQISFVDLRDGYQEAAAGLLAGGVDLFVIETCQDLLQVKAAVIGCRRAMAAAGRQVPLQAQVTIELTGRMLMGTEIGAALTTMEALAPDVVGILRYRPQEMSEHLRYLSQHARVPLACLPNAGLPSVVEGKMHYDLTPGQLAEHHARFVTEYGLSVVGGCCGTTPEHLAAVVAACRDLQPGQRQPRWEPGCASIYTHVPFDQEPSVLMVGERTNANGSRRFREAMLASDWDTCVAMARDQEKEGAHVIDLCVDYTGEDGVADMAELARRFATQSTACRSCWTRPRTAVIETGLQRIAEPAPCSTPVNLEDGSSPRTSSTLPQLLWEYGAAVVSSTSRARPARLEWKLRAARTPSTTWRWSATGWTSDLLNLSPLLLPISTGMEESRRDGIKDHPRASA